MNQAKKRNCSIDIFRYICAVTVIIGHTQPLMDVNEKLGYFTAFILPRLTVPFFLAVAGYFYIPKLLAGKAACFRYVSKTLQTYAIWSIPYLIVNFVNQVIKGDRGIISFILGSIKAFIFDGTNEHFWFFPALICAICMSTLICRLKGEKLLIPIALVLFVTGCLGCGYYEIGSRIPVLGKIYNFSYFTFIRRCFFMGYPFLVGGYVIRLIEKKMENRKVLFGALAASFAFYVIELIIVHWLNLQADLSLTLGIYPLMCTIVLVLLKNPVDDKGETSRMCNTLANFSYYAHPLFMMFFTWICKVLFGVTITQTPLCIATVLMTFVVGYIIFKVNNKKLNSLVL